VRRAVLSLLALALVLVTAGAAMPASAAGGVFSDVRADTPFAADIEWLAAEGITDKAGLDRKLFGHGSNNGTFVVDGNDRFRDRHGGGESILDEAASHLAAPKDIFEDLPQVYTAGPGNVLGNFIVRRIRHAAGGHGLRKWKV
jgi:hypothetical protein